MEYDLTDTEINTEDEMASCLVGNLVVVINTRGAIAMTNSEYPAKYGLYGEIRTREYAFHFNPTGEIRYIRGLTPAWPHPWEWLKRTWGNDWVYYTVGLNRGQGRVKDWMGENYLPCLSYKSNTIKEVTPWTEPGVAPAFSAWSQVYGTLSTTSLDGVPEEIREFLEAVIRTNDESELIRQTEQLHEIIGGPVSVLPPDTRHVDYEVVPINIADGCLYRCRFCSVKTGNAFRKKGTEEIREQLDRLHDYYGHNLQNLNAIFIGGHDALAAGVDLVAFTAEAAFRKFGFQNTQSRPAMAFLFGSAGSFLGTDISEFDKLNRLPYKSYINIGLEAIDGETLTHLGKPITPEMVRNTLEKMIQVNTRFQNIEVTANFLLGTTFSDAHHEKINDLLHSLPETTERKGCIYLSPLVEIEQREKVLPMFFQIKEASRLPVFIYLIQRL